MEVIPAIDTRGGRIAVVAGDEVMEVPGDPLETAGRYRGSGAGWVHLVDLDSALGGHPADLSLVPRVAGLGLSVQVAGLRTTADCLAAIAAGAARVVLSSGSLGDRDLVAQLVDGLGTRLAVSLDVREGRVSARGGGGPNETVEEALSWLESAGVPRYVYAALDREGGGAGPDVEGARRLVEMTDSPVLVSGGVGTVADIRRLSSAGVEGAIVGRSLLEGRLDLADALAVAR